MTLSIRRQSAARKKRNNRSTILESRRKQAVTMLLERKTMRTIRDITGLPLGTICRLSQAIKKAQTANENTSNIHYNHKPGRRTVLTDIEESQICERMKFVASRGFATTVDVLKSVAAKIAKDGRNGFKNHYPSDHRIRSFRSRHPEAVTLRGMENKNVAEILAEHPDHVETLVRSLMECERLNPGILSDPDMIFNLDETEVCGQHGRMKKAFVSAVTHCRGYNMSFSKPGKHLTACVVASAAGKVLPPFLIFEGKKNMDRWYEPLPNEIYKDNSGVPHWLAQENWYPDHAAEYGSENGSMTKDLIGLIMSHIRLHAPKAPEPNRKLLLILDGHKSRNGVEWLEKAVSFNIEVIQSPANTTLFLQPCDNDINRTFQRAVRSTHDQLSSIAHLNFRDLGNRINLAIAGYRSLTPSVVQATFRNTRVWPMDFRFHRLAIERHSGKMAEKQKVSEREQRRLFFEHLTNVRDILKSKGSSDQVWSTISQYVQDTNKKATDIIVKCTVTSEKSVKFILEGRSGFDMTKAAPGVYLTHKGVFEMRKKKAENNAAAKESKTDEKRKQAEKKLESCDDKRGHKKSRQKLPITANPTDDTGLQKQNENIIGSRLLREAAGGGPNGENKLPCAFDATVCGQNNARTKRQTFRSQMCSEAKSAELEKMIRCDVNCNDNEVARVLLDMHKIDPNVADTHDMVFDYSVGDQTVLEKPEYAPFLLVPKE